MRYIGILFALVITLGCGAGRPEPNLHSTVAVPVAAPQIMELVPASVPANSTPFALTVNGSNFGTDSIAFWNGVAQSTTVITPNQLIVNITSTDLQTSGLVPVFVLTEGFRSNTIDFDVAFQ